MRAPYWLVQRNGNPMEFWDAKHKCWTVDMNSATRYPCFARLSVPGGMWYEVPERQLPRENTDSYRRKWEHPPDEVSNG